MTVDIDTPPTIVWVDDHVEIIDQTLLPTEVRVIELRTVEDVVDAIGRLAVRGAPAIGACGAYGVVVAIDQLIAAGRSVGPDELDPIAERDRHYVGPLDAKDRFDPQPAAPAPGPGRIGQVFVAFEHMRVLDLEHLVVLGEDPAVDRVLGRLDPSGDAATRREEALAEAQAVCAEDRDACDAIGRHGAAEIPEARTLMTHCNAGRLATTGIGTALGVIYGKAREGHEVEVYASETRPLLQGARLTVWELTSAGIPVTLIPDSAACGLLASGRVDAVVVGADRIAANGDVANKVGTFSHAVAAVRAGVPFYVAAPTSTIDAATASGAQIQIEARADDEVQASELRSAHPGPMSVWNPAFDVTPAELVTGIITEVGVLRPDYRESIAAALVD